MPQLAQEGPASASTHHDNSVTTTASAPAVIAAATLSVSGTGTAGATSTSTDHDASAASARARDIARSVDFLRVLAGAKPTLAAADDPGDGSGGGYVPFGGQGNRLSSSSSSSSSSNNNGGSGDAPPPPPMDPSRDPNKKRVVIDASGRIGFAKGFADSEGERAKRAAAALARLQQAPGDHQLASYS